MRYRCGFSDIDMGDDRIDTAILDIGMGVLVTLWALRDGGCGRRRGCAGVGGSRRMEHATSSSAI